jgi:hypothetical protein
MILKVSKEVDSLYEMRRGGMKRMMSHQLGEGVTGGVLVLCFFLSKSTDVQSKYCKWRTCSVSLTFGLGDILQKSIPHDVRIHVPYLAEKYVKVLG